MCTIWDISICVNANNGNCQNQSYNEVLRDLMFLRFLDKEIISVNMTNKNVATYCAALRDVCFTSY